MGNETKGFASMDKAKQREIASKGGKAAHAKGNAHEWTSEEARAAGRKGGLASSRQRSQRVASPEAGVERTDPRGSGDSALGGGTDARQLPPVATGLARHQPDTRRYPDHPWRIPRS